MMKFLGCVVRPGDSNIDRVPGWGEPLSPVGPEAILPDRERTRRSWTTPMIGLEIGRTIERRARQRDAPSIAAASRISRESHRRTSLSRKMLKALATGRQPDCLGGADQLTCRRGPVWPRHGTAARSDGGGIIRVASIMPKMAFTQTAGALRTHRQRQRRI